MSYEQLQWLSAAPQARRIGLLNTILLLLRALRTNRLLWQNKVFGKKVVQSGKWE
jgi:hypothetical protein